LAAVLCLSTLAGCVETTGNNKMAAMDAQAAALSPSPLGHYLSARLAHDELDAGRADR
jgi:hypothetical protein